MYLDKLQTLPTEYKTANSTRPPIPSQKKNDDKIDMKHPRTNNAINPFILVDQLNVEFFHNYN